MKKPANFRRGAGFNGKQMSLLPEPPFSPQWPNPSILARQVLDRLRTNTRCAIRGIQHGEVTK